MAYNIIGVVHKMYQTEQIQTRTGSMLQRKTIVLCQRRFDQNTGKEYEPNFITLDFTNKGCADVERFKVGDRVKIGFDVSGTRYADKTSGEEKYFTSLRAFRIEPYQQPTLQQPQPQPQPQMQQRGAQQTPQQGGYNDGNYPF